MSFSNVCISESASATIRPFDHASWFSRLWPNVHPVMYVMGFPYRQLPLAKDVRRLFESSFKYGKSSETTRSPTEGRCSLSARLILACCEALDEAHELTSSRALPMPYAKQCAPIEE